MADTDHDDRSGIDRSRIDGLIAEVRMALDRAPQATMTLFSAPAREVDDAALRQDLAAEIAAGAGLKPWPEWAAVRHGVGQGAHFLNIVDELGSTGRAAGVVVCFLTPVEPSLVTQAAAVAGDAGLELIAVGEITVP